ncbi:hypothetical protein M9Y10_040676 [Tritrichomonas musculus]|uniref:Uncharacterized protein n=1 Tax=Tritrichomonas musculus TaxID=1915356 RepID=A0ABR2K394_9EUKA
MLFDPPKNHGSIIQQAQKYQRIIKAPHRPYFLSPQEVNQIKEALLQIDDYPCVEDISIYIAMMFNKYPSRSTIKRAIKKRIEGFKIVEVKPIEEDRYDVTLKEIENYYYELKVEAIGVPVGFIFNLDESGQKQYVDDPYMYIVFPEDKEISTYPLNRTTKRITPLYKRILYAQTFYRLDDK